MTKGFEPAILLPVLQPSTEERLATLALCEKYGWEIPAGLQTLKNERDVAAAGFQRPPVGTISERAAAIKQKAALQFESKIEPTEIPDFVAAQNAAQQSVLQKEIDRLQRKPEGL
jgi:hypothetical protein